MVKYYTVGELWGPYVCQVCKTEESAWVIKLTEEEHSKATEQTDVHPVNYMCANKLGVSMCDKCWSIDRAKETIKDLQTKLSEANAKLAEEKARWLEWKSADCDLCKLEYVTKEWKRSNLALRGFFTFYESSARCPVCGAVWNEHAEQHNQVEYKGKMRPCPAEEIE